MTKEQFISALEKNLKYLTDEAKIEELKKYKNLNNYDLDPIAEANKIYKARGIKETISEKIKFLEAATIITNTLQGKDKQKIKNVLLFFLYLLFLVILIKVPFIYVRDIIANILNGIFTNNNAYAIWYLLFEILYAITAISIFIKLIKNKALELEKNV